ncbi:hypothetical protein D3C80_1306930 [compost metagenome]
MPRCVCKAGFCRRMRLSWAISAMMLPGALKSRGRISYFSESRYSSLPGIGADSQSSNPEYMPHNPEPMVASAARMRKPARPESCRKNGLMSGVLTKKLGR